MGARRLCPGLLHVLWLCGGGAEKLQIHDRHDLQAFWCLDRQYLFTWSQIWFCHLLCWVCYLPYSFFKLQLTSDPVNLRSVLLTTLGSEPLGLSSFVKVSLKNAFRPSPLRLLATPKWVLRVPHHTVATSTLSRKIHLLMAQSHHRHRHSDFLCLQPQIKNHF